MSVFPAESICASSPCQHQGTCTEMETGYTCYCQPGWTGDHCQIGETYPDSKLHGANMGTSWGRQDPGGSHVGPMNFAVWVASNDRHTRHNLTDRVETATARFSVFRFVWAGYYVIVQWRKRRHIHFLRYGKAVNIPLIDLPMSIRIH